MVDSKLLEFHRQELLNQYVILTAIKATLGYNLGKLTRGEDSFNLLLDGCMDDTKSLLHLISGGNDEKN